jgi:hypothetical protein
MLTITDTSADETDAHAGRRGFPSSEPGADDESFSG